MRLVANVGEPGAGTRGAASVVVSEAGSDAPLATIDLVRERVRLLPGRALRRDSLGVIRFAAAAADASCDREAILRAALDRLLTADDRPDVVRIAVDAASADDLALLSRLAIALDGRAHSVRGGRAVDVALPGLLTLLRYRPWALRWHDVAGTLVARRRYRGRATTGEILFLARTTAPRDVPAPRGIAFAIVDAAIVRERPVRYGMPLSAPIEDDGTSWCVAGTARGTLVFRMWATFGAQAVRGRPAAHPAATANDTLFVSHAWTAPARRGRGIFPAALEWLARAARVRGVEYMLISIRDDNAPSLAAAGRAGFVVLPRAHAVTTG